MKKLLVLICLCIAVTVDAQILKSSFGDMITIKRMSNEELKILSANNTGAYTYVLIVEKELNGYKSAVQNNLLVYKPMQSADDLAMLKDQLKNAAPTKHKIPALQFDVEDYRKEIDFYVAYNARKKIAMQAEQDSIKKADDLAYKLEKKMDDSLKLIQKEIIKNDETKVSDDRIKNIVGGSNNRLVVFCGYDINNVLIPFSFYLSSIGYGSVDDKRIPSMTKSYAAFRKRISTSFDKNIYVTFNVKSNGEVFIVEDCTITGSWNELATIFVNYWKTKMNFDEMKNQKDVIKYCGSDKIAFQSNLPEGTAKIHITNN